MALRGRRHFRQREGRASVSGGAAAAAAAEKIILFSRGKLEETSFRNLLFLVDFFCVSSFTPGPENKKNICLTIA